MTKQVLTAAIAGTLALSTGVFADDSAKIAELEAKVAALEARQSQNNKDVASTIDAVLRDAEKRSQLLAAGDSTAGYDEKGAFFRKGDEFLLRVNAFFQFRNVTDWRDSDTSFTDSDEGDDGEEEITNGFEIRRMKFELTGYAFTKDLEYVFVWATDRDGGSMYLEDAYIRYMFAQDLYLLAGQFKDPVNHEELVSAKRQLAADRSLANEYLAGGRLDRVQGAGIVYGGAKDKKNPINATVVLTDGANTDNTNYMNTGNQNFGVAARVEFLAMGDWKDYQDFTAKGTKEDLLVIGAGIDWTQSQTPDTTEASADAYTFAIDLQYENANGLGFFIAGHYLDSDLLDANPWGIVAQVGYLVDGKQLEVFGRVGYVDLDIDSDLADDFNEVWELTFGINYYLGKDGAAGHRAKVTVDVTWLPEGSPEIDGLGYGGSADDEVVIRGQFQLLI